MAAFRIDTAAAIRELENAGVGSRQAAAIVSLHAEADAALATKVDVDGLRTELKADIDGLRTELKADVDGLRTELKADIDGLRTELKADIDGLRTELKADIDLLREQMEANNRLVYQQMQTGFAEVMSAVAANNAEQQRRANLFLGSLIAVAALILGGLAVL